MILKRDKRELKKKNRNKQSLITSVNTSNNIKKSILSNIFITRKKSEISDNVKSKDDITYTINSNDICGLEALPGKIKLTDIPKNDNQKPNLIHEYIKRNFISKLSSSVNTERIQTISNKHKAAEQIPEQMLAIEKEVKEIAADTALHLKDRNPNGNLQFGLFERKKKKLV